MASSLVLLKRWYRWFRLVHLYGGLFVSPFVVVFALSAIVLNHPWMSSRPAEPTRREATIDVPAGLKGLELAKEVMRQTGVRGEIDFFPPDAQGPRLNIPVSTPGQKITINANLASKTATVSERTTTFSERVNYLHKSPGPHLVGFRGNWVFTRIWSVLADATVYVLLLVTATGVYLWALVKAERKRGLVFLGAGCLCFALAVLALVR